MKKMLVLTGAAALVLGLGAGALVARQASQRYVVGNPLGLPIEPSAAGTFAAMSSNVKVYGAIYSAESCSYDPVRNLIVVPNRGVPQNVQVNNAWISLLNHDGSVHTARWIGVQAAGAPRAALTPPLVLNEPYGSDIVNGTLYLADRDGSTGPADKGVAVIRRFSMTTGEPSGETRVPAVEWFNDIAVAADGTVYGTVTGGTTDADAATWQVWRIPPQGEATVVVQGAPLKRPNGIALDAKGNLVVVNMLTPDVQTLSPDGKVAEDRTGGPGGQRRHRHPARRHQVREQRDAGRRLADAPRAAGRPHRDQHPQRRVDVLRRRRQSVGDPDERQQRAGVREAELTAAGPETFMAYDAHIASYHDAAMSREPMETVTISPKFQVVIPKAIRDRLKLKAGQQVQAIAYEDRIELVPVRTARSLRGRFEGLDTTVPREGDRV